MWTKKLWSLDFCLFVYLGKIQLIFFISPITEHRLYYLMEDTSGIFTEVVYIFCCSWKGTSLSQERFLWGIVECILNTHSFLYILYHCTLIIVHCVCHHDVIYIWLSEMICSQSKWLWLWDFTSWIFYEEGFYVVDFYSTSVL